MPGISDIGTRLSQQYMLEILRGKLNDTQRQVNTGKKSDNLAGLGTLGAANSISFRNTRNLLENYKDNLNMTKTRLTVMDQAMSTMTEAGRDTLNRLRSLLQGTVPQAAILSDEAKTKLQNVSEKLNASVNDRYLFAGDDIFNPPFADALTLNATATTDVTAWLAGAPTATSVVSDARLNTGTALGFSATSLTAGNVFIRGDNSTDIDYTLLANRPGFSDVLRGLAIVSNLPQPTTPAEQTNYWTIVNGAIELLDAGTKAIDQYQGVLGNKAKLIDDLLAQHEQTQGTYEIFIGNVEDADMADASTRLTFLQTQLQASYSVIAQVKDLSLVNFI